MLLQSAIQQLKLSQLNQGEKRWVGQIQGSIGSLLLSEIAQQHDKPIVVIARNHQHLAQLESEIEFYGQNVRVFPDWETLPYDRCSPICQSQVSS